MFCKKRLIYLFNLLFCVNASFAQSTSTQSNLVDAAFSAVKKTISIFEAGANEEGAYISLCADI